MQVRELEVGLPVPLADCGRILPTVQRRAYGKVVAETAADKAVDVKAVAENVAAEKAAADRAAAEKVLRRRLLKSERGLRRRMASSISSKPEQSNKFVS